MLFRSDRKSTRLNSSHTIISYAVFCLKKKKKNDQCGDREPRLSRNAAIAMRVRCRLSQTLQACLGCRPPCLLPLFRLFFFNDTATTEIYTLSLHDALPI